MGVNALGAGTLIQAIMTTHETSNDTQPSEPMSRDHLISALTDLSLADELAFRRRLKKARAPKALAAIAADMDRARQKVARIDAAVPDVTYPEQQIGRAHV